MKNELNCRNWLIFLIIYSQIEKSQTQFLNQLCSDIYPQNSTNVVLVLIDIHDQSINSELCGALNSDEITNIVQIYYAMDQINMNLNSPTFKGSYTLTGTLGK